MYCYGNKKYLITCCIAAINKQANEVNEGNNKVVTADSVEIEEYNNVEVL